MSAKYPRVSIAARRAKWIENPTSAPKCDVCGEPATHRVCVEVNWFRGDDEVCNACDAHKNDAAALVRSKR